MATISGINSPEEKILQTALSLYLSDEPIFPEERDIFSELESRNGDIDPDTWTNAYPPLFAPPSTPSFQISNPPSSHAEYPLSVFDVDLTPFYIHDALTKKSVQNMSPMERYLFTEYPGLCLSSGNLSLNSQPNNPKLEQLPKTEDPHCDNTGTARSLNHNVRENNTAKATATTTTTTMTTTVGIGFSLNSDHSIVKMEATYNCVLTQGS